MAGIAKSLAKQMVVGAVKEQLQKEANTARDQQQGGGGGGGGGPIYDQYGRAVPMHVQQQAPQYYDQYGRPVAPPPQQQQQYAGPVDQATGGALSGVTREVDKTIKSAKEEIARQAVKTAVNNPALVAGVVVAGAGAMMGGGSGGNSGGGVRAGGATSSSGGVLKDVAKGVVGGMVGGGGSTNAGTSRNAYGNQQPAPSGGGGFLSDFAKGFSGGYTGDAGAPPQQPHHQPPAPPAPQAVQWGAQQPLAPVHDAPPAVSMAAPSAPLNCAGPPPDTDAAGGASRDAGNTGSGTTTGPAATATAGAAAAATAVVGVGRFLKRGLSKAMAGGGKDAAAPSAGAPAVPSAPPPPEVLGGGGGAPGVACPACTFLNAPAAAVCEMCATRLR